MQLSGQLLNLCEFCMAMCVVDTRMMWVSNFKFIIVSSCLYHHSIDPRGHAVFDTCTLANGCVYRRFYVAVLIRPIGIAVFLCQAGNPFGSAFQVCQTGTAETALR